MAGDALPGDRRLYAFVGELGSGKTEVALNYSLWLAEAGRRVAVVDLDIVNPYFRVLEHRARLEGRGVRVVAPPDRFAAFDAPAIPDEALSVFRDPEWTGIFDLGGGPAGARALGGFASLFGEYAEQYAVWIVVNARRPTTRTEDDIAAMIRHIEASSSLSATGLVSNTHLCEETTADDVLAGHAVTSAAAGRRGLPVVFAAVDHRLADEVRLDCPILPIRRQVRLPWEQAPRRA
jgi:hypothetical protein